MRSSHTLVLLSVLAALGGGCAPGNPGLVIDGVIAPPTSGGCTYDATATAFLFEGVLDTTTLTSVIPTGPLMPRYTAHLRASNHLINLFNGTYPLRADPNRMTIIAADVEITNIDGSITAFGALPNPFRVVASGVIPSAASDAPGVGVTAVEFIPAQYAAALAAGGGGTQRLIVAVTLIGRTSGDAGVESNPFIFPIDVCAGCLLSCTTDVMGTTIPCSPGQDSVTVLPVGSPPC